MSKRMIKDKQFEFSQNKSSVTMPKLDPMGRNLPTKNGKSQVPL